MNASKTRKNWVADSTPSTKVISSVISVHPSISKQFIHQQTFSMSKKQCPSLRRWWVSIALGAVLSIHGEDGIVQLVGVGHRQLRQSHRRVHNDAALDAVGDGGVDALDVHGHVAKLHLESVMAVGGRAPAGGSELAVEDGAIHILPAHLEERHAVRSLVI